MIEFDAGDSGDSKTWVVNAMVDVTISPGLAFSLGGGLGFAPVDFDNIDADRADEDVNVVDDSVAGFAYQGHVAIRCDLNPSSLLSLGYTYFTTAELDAEDVVERSTCPFRPEARRSVRSRVRCFPPSWRRRSEDSPHH